MGTERLFHTQQVHYLRLTIGYANENETDIGSIPSGSLILRPMSGLHVSTAFNATTTNVLDVGLANDPDDPNLFATGIDLKSTIPYLTFDEAATGYLVTHDVTVTCTVSHTGAVATAGSGEVFICYIPDNDG